MECVLADDIRLHQRARRSIRRRVEGSRRRLSQSGRNIPDLLIAAAAEDAGLMVLHYDADFDRIYVVTGQKCEWVVPAGSID